MPEMIRVQVAYARPDTVFLQDLQIAVGSSVQQALEQSDLSAQLPELDLQTVTVGVHGKLKSLDTALRDGDRVEVYRSLLADPKDARRRRAVKQKRETGN